MEQEIARVEKMVKEGKISRAEADKLLSVLPKSEVHKQPRGKAKRPLFVLGLFMAVVAAGLLFYFIPNPRSTEPASKPSNETSGNDKPRSQKPSQAYRVMELPGSSVAGQGEMLLLQGERKLALPLLSTDVTGKITGFLARITVIQTYVNPMDKALEAVYVFPLPDNSAVDSMTMSIGRKKIRGVIKAREEARAAYEQARREGKTASLLEQERPNIFTQSVANILPNDTIRVTISYVQELKYRKGVYSFHFPMVVGPRYIPGSALHPEARGSENPTDQVTDAHKITPSIVPLPFRSGHEISLSLVIDAGMAVKELECPSHKIKVQEEARVMTVSLLPNDNIPNKDFIVDYRVGEAEIKPVTRVHREKGQEGFVQLILFPQIKAVEEDIFPRELIFVVDNSGSMQGEPVEKCKEVMRLCLKNMRSRDVFNVLRFAGNASTLWPESHRADKKGVDDGLNYVDGMEGGGGTEMLSAIKMLFDLPHRDGYRRLIFFMTDGYVGNEAAILTAIRERLGQSRVFGLGVGSSVNRYLLEGMGYAGRGATRIIRQDGNAKGAMQEFYEMVDAPVLTDISLEWQGLNVVDQQPVGIPDLFTGQPLVVTAKYSKPGKGVLIVKGNLPHDKIFETSIDLDLPDEQKNNGVLATLWARKRIGEIELMGSRLFESNAYTPEEVKEQVLKIALAYRIMSSYTSFVAIDDAVRNKDGKWTTVEQPVEMPEGVSPASQPGHRFAEVSVVKFKIASASTGHFNQGYAGSGGSGHAIDDLLGQLGGSGGSGVAAAAAVGRTGNNVSRGVRIAKASENAMHQARRAYIDLPEEGMLVFKGDTLGNRKISEIRMRIMQYLAQLRPDYLKQLSRTPNLTGKLIIRMAIDSKGNVTSCRIINTSLNNGEFEGVVVSRIQTWKFEACPGCGSTVITWPFSFVQ